MENPGGAIEAQAFLARDLGYRALGCDVAVKNCKVAVRFNGIAEVANNVLTFWIVLDIFEILSQRLAGYGHAIAVQQALVEHALHQRLDSTDLDKLRHQVFATGFHISQYGNPRTNLGEIVK